MDYGTCEYIILLNSHIHGRRILGHVEDNDSYSRSRGHIVAGPIIELMHHLPSTNRREGHWTNVLMID